MINGRRALSLALYNCTMAETKNVFTDFNETFFDYWTGRSGPADLVSKQSALTGKVIPRPNIAPETCGVGWNCSYTVSFKAPGYKCAEIARGKKLDAPKLFDQGVPFGPNDLVPQGPYSYIAWTNQGDYYNYQVNLTQKKGDNYGLPEMKPPYPKNFGAFRTEPVLWIGYSSFTGTGVPPSNRDVPGWYDAYEAAVMRCDHYLTEYTVLFNHTFTDQTTTVLKRNYLHPIIDTTLVPAKKLSDGITIDRNSTDGTNDWNKAVPESNYVFPRDLKRYRLTAAYHTMGHTMRNFLEGYIEYEPYPQVETQMANVGLVDTETYLPDVNFPEMITSFYERIILSLLSNPQFLVVTWAAKPDQSSGVSNTTDPALAYPCTKTRISNAYQYNRRDMWIAYTVAIFASLVCVLLGTAALSQNNYHVRDVHVSSFVAATRAPCLENLPWKQSKWGEVSEDILDTRLGYGIIADAGPNGTPAGVGFVDVGSPAGGEGGVMVVGRKVYYGFAPPEVLERTRAATFGPGKPRPRSSAFSFRTWEAGSPRYT